MAKLTEILDVEKRRTAPEDLRTIHLWADGSFYRAYEWSAWLCVRYIKQFKVTKRMIKSVGEDMLFVGFPQTSLEKFQPNDASLVPKDDKSVDLLLPEELVRPDEGSTLEQDFQNWRTTIPLVEGKDSQVSRSDGRSPRSVSMTGIMKQLLDFSVESHSPIDCMLFLAELKSQVSSLL